MDDLDKVRDRLDWEENQDRPYLDPPEIAVAVVLGLLLAGVVWVVIGWLMK